MNAITKGTMIRRLIHSKIGKKLSFTTGFKLIKTNLEMLTTKIEGKSRQNRQDSRLCLESKTLFKLFFLNRKIEEKSERLEIMS